LLVITLAHPQLKNNMSIKITETNITGGTIKSVSSPHGSFNESATAPTVTQSNYVVDNATVVSETVTLSSSSTIDSSVVSIDNASNRIKYITVETTGTGTLDLLGLYSSSTARIDLKTAFGGTINLGSSYGIAPVYGSSAGQFFDYSDTSRSNC
jgi:hypothetical protein